MSGEQPSDPYLAKRRRTESENRVQSPAGAFYDKRYLLKIIDELTAENARLNMEMEAYRQKLTPKDVEAMTAVIKALTAAKQMPRTCIHGRPLRECCDYVGPATPASGLK